MSTEYVNYLLDQLALLGPVRARRMFGGHGLYLDDLMFALIADDTLYLESDEQSRARYAAAGCEPFVYHRGARAIEMSYRRAPDEALDDGEALRDWARRAIESAMRSAAASPRRPRAAAGTQ